MDVKKTKMKKTFEMSASSEMNLQAKEKHMERDSDDGYSKEILEESNSDQEMERDEEQEIDHSKDRVEQEEEKEEPPASSKKRRRQNHPEMPDDDKSSSLIIWSKEDEVRLLNILVNFKKKNGNIKGSNVYVKHKFKNVFTVQQIQYKIKRIKKKHKSYKTKVEDHGSEDVLNSYQKEIFKLCELIWNEENVVVNNKEEKIKLLFDVDCYLDDITKDYSDELMDKNILRKGFGILESSHKKRLMVKWAELRKAEMEVSLKRSALLCEYLGLTYEAFNSSTLT